MSGPVHFFWASVFPFKPVDPVLRTCDGKVATW